MDNQEYYPEAEGLPYLFGGVQSCAKYETWGWKHEHVHPALPLGWVHGQKHLRDVIPFTYRWRKVK